MEKTQLDVDFSTSGTRRRKMVSMKRYNYKVIVCYLLDKSKKFFKRMEDTSKVEESMEQLVGLCKRLKVIEGK